MVASLDRAVGAAHTPLLCPLLEPASVCSSLQELPRIKLVSTRGSAEQAQNDGRWSWTLAVCGTSVHAESAFTRHICAIDCGRDGGCQSAPHVYPQVFSGASAVVVFLSAG